jgi:iron complex outermembrane receptor protein
MTMRLRRTALIGLLAATSVAAIAQPAAAQTAAETRRQSYNIPAGELVPALQRFARQSRMQVIYSAANLRGRRTAGVRGEMTAAAALQRLVAGSGAQLVQDSSGAYLVRTDQQSGEAQAGGAAADDESVDAAQVGVAEILVVGSRSQNVDIRRSEDDPQPYIVFDSDDIERSGATSLEQFLQQQLTAATNVINNGAGGGIAGPSFSRITLRGLSSSETLILIDGHRASSPAIFGTLSQTDVTGIPLAAIERVEVLPTTASGIYGGNATGGAINIVLRRDYTGVEVRGSHSTTTSGYTPRTRLSATSGIGLGGGDTNILLSASYSSGGSLLLRDRLRIIRARRDRIRNNDPQSFLSPFTQPLGSTPNIYSLDGSNLVLRNGVALGSAFTSVPEGYRGVTVDGGAALVSRAGTFNWDFASTSQGPDATQVALIAQPTVISGSLLLRHALTSEISVFFDASASRDETFFPSSAISQFYYLPAAAPTNPFLQDVFVRAPVDVEENIGGRNTARRLRGVSGVLWQISPRWSLGLDYTWDQTRVKVQLPSTSRAFASAVSGGAVDILADASVAPYPIEQYPIVPISVTSPITSTLNDLSLRVGGSLFSLPGGRVAVTGAVAHRQERVATAFNFSIASSATTVYPARSQSVDSAYIEVTVPIFSAANSQPGFRELEIQLASRAERYKNVARESQLYFGDAPPPPGQEYVNEFTSFNPTIALRWAPTEWVAFRASYGTGFLPPGLDQVTPQFLGFDTPVVDPRRGNSTTLVPYQIGGNPNLRPERSESFSLGLILTPRIVPGLRMSLDYTNLEKRDNITSFPNFQQGLVDNEELFPDRVIRGPRNVGDPVGWPGPIIGVDASVLNIARANIEAWDMRITYDRRLPSGANLELSLNTTYQPRLERVIVEGLPTIDFSSLSPQLRATSTIAWSRGGTTLTGSMRYFGSYRVEDNYILGQGRGGRVSDQAYLDLTARYDIPAGSGRAFQGMSVELAVSNVFNSAPPFDSSNPFGYYSPYADMLLRTVQIGLRKRF